MASGEGLGNQRLVHRAQRGQRNKQRRCALADADTMSMRGCAGDLAGALAWMAGFDKDKWDIQRWLAHARAAWSPRQHASGELQATQSPLAHRHGRFAFNRMSSHACRSYASPST